MNVRIELMLTDSVEDKVIADERFSTILADLQPGKVRRLNQPRPSPTPPSSTKGGAFEVDLIPEIVGDRVKITLTLSYAAAAGPAATDETVRVTFVENVSSFFESGKPLTIIEVQGDPVGNRRVVVQVTATILK